MPQSQKPSFAPLKCQTHYSVLRSTVKVDQLIAHAARNGHRFLGISDLDTLSGFHEFYSKCRAAGIKPVIGATVDVCDRPHDDQKNADGHRISLLCKNYEGLLNLIRLLNDGHRRFAQDPARARHARFFVTGREIMDRQAGLYCIFPNVTSFVYRQTARGHADVANRQFGEFVSAFGAERVLLEIWKDQVPHEDDANLLFLELAKKTGVRAFAAANCQYLTPDEHMRSFAAIYAMRNDIPFAEARTRLDGTGHFHFKTSAEMTQAFSHLGGLLECSVDLAFECSVELPEPSPKMPEFAVPEGFTEDDYLAFVTRQKLDNFHLSGDPEYCERLEHELSVIRKMRFSGYFLLVSDIVAFARERSIPTGPGRGSACSSLVCMLLGITRVDPVSNRLMFERFLNPDRAKMPDIDIDFASSARYSIMEYLTRKYGNDRVAQILTFNHFKHKALFGALSKIMGAPERTTRDAVTIIDRMVRENPAISFDEIFMRFPRAIREEKALSGFAAIAAPLLNNIRQTSIHAGGVIVSPHPLSGSIPLSAPNDSLSLTAVDMNVLEAMGYLKIDLLGINALEKIEEVRKQIRETTGADIDIDAIPLDDRRTFDLISSGDTFGIFQLETRLFRNYLPQIKVRDLDELAVAVALIRPGPINGNVVSDYVMRKSGRAKIEYPIAEMKEILHDTYGLIVFQEQIMMIATEIFGYSYSEADIFRDIMSKKRTDKMEEERDRFMDRAKARKIDLRTAVYVFGLISKFAEYGFNKAHSVAYSRIAYTMAYLMSNYPVEYMVALLNSDVKGSGDDYNARVNFLRKRRIPVLGVDINASGLYYSIERADAQSKGPSPAEDDASPASGTGASQDSAAPLVSIRSGFLKIPGISAIAAADIVADRAKHGPFANLADLTSRIVSERSRVKVTDIESLIKHGAFDSISEGATRERMNSGLKELLFNRRRSFRSEGPGTAGQIDIFNGGGRPAAGAPGDPARPAFDGKAPGRFMPVSDSAAPSVPYEIIKYLRVPSVSAALSGLAAAAVRQPADGASPTMQVFGVISGFNPAIMEISLSDARNPETGAMKIFVPEELAPALERISGGQPAIVDYEAAGRMSFNDGAEDKEIVVTARGITPLREAMPSLTACVEIGAGAGESQALSMIKHFIDSHAGLMPLVIKRGPVRIVTNKKIDFSEKFVRDVLSAGRSGVTVEVYIVPRLS